MKKTTIVEQALSGFRFLNPDDHELLSEELKEYEKNTAFTDDNKLAVGLMKDIPKLQLLHEAAVRRSLQKIETNTSVVKTILLIYFICSVVTALYFISQAS